MSITACPLCQPSQPLWAGPDCYVLAVNDSPFPGYTRVVWGEHQAEMSNLSVSQRQRLMEIVNLVERIQRDYLGTDKINLAQFGNQVPHLHWHIIPRWQDDPYFPDSAWSAPAAREKDQILAWETHHASLQQKLPAYWQALRTQLQTQFA